MRKIAYAAALLGCIWLDGFRCMNTSGENTPVDVSTPSATPGSGSNTAGTAATGGNSVVLGDTAGMTNNADSVLNDTLPH